MKRTNAVIMGGVTRDIHSFNTCFRRMKYTVARICIKRFKN